MPGVREEGQRIGQPAADCFGHEHDEREAQRELQRARRVVVRVTAVRVIVSVIVRMIVAVHGT